MSKQRTLLVAGSTVVGVAGTLLLGPADALFAATEPSLGNAATDPTGNQPAAAAKPSPSTSAPAKASTPKASASAKPATTGKTFSGSSSIAGGRYGTMKLTVTVQNGKLTKIDYSKTSVNDNRSYQIAVQSLPILVKEALSAQSAHISNVSGASYTTQAFATALQNAMTKAGI